MAWTETGDTDYNMEMHGMPPDFDTAKISLRNLAKALRDLHRALVDAARNEYEKEHGPVADAGQLLQLLTKHPQFDWLHQLSEFMVDIDELLDEETVPESDLRSVYSQAKSLLASSAEDQPSDFSRHYLALLQHYPAIVMAHADVRRILASM